MPVLAVGAAFLAGLAAGAVLGAAWAARAARRDALRLGRFLSYAAHELTTPVTAVNMTILNILHGAFGRPSPEQTPWLEMMREQVGRLGGLIGELRDFADLSLGRPLRLHREDAAPADLLEAALKLVRHGCQQAGVGLEIAAEKRLPRLSADADRVSRSLGTLLLHARKFRGAGDIAVSVGTRDKTISFSVEYAASRLPAGDPAEALDLFYPAVERADGSMSATGLGLGVARSVARAHGGELSLEVGGSGAARLLFTLPVKS